jgi:spore coat polysaccharide biosynthesis protein SpsF (cytidylyltransferase family)
MIAAIVQARMGSTRLPEKIMADIEGKPLLEHVIERTKASRYIETVIIATTENKKDEAVIRFAREREIPCYGGSEDDVLDRYYQAAKKFGADTIVRITPDDPFKDPEVIDLIISRYLEGKLDYASNTIRPTYPEGLDIEVFSFNALEKAWREAKKPSEREHVTPYIWNHPEFFRLTNVENNEDLSGLRWTIDYEADLRFAREVYARLYSSRVFLMRDILELLKAEPELADINRGTVRNEGYLKSLSQE